MCVPKGISAIRILLLACLLSVCSSSAVAIAADSSTPKLGGKWSGTYSGAFSGTFKIQWLQSGSKLSGTIALSKPKGTYGITGSVLRGGAIQFGAVSVGARYTGKVSSSGKSMSGKYTTAQGGGSWSARKTS